MERLVVLGTGNALATACYNTCFALENDRGIVLVDAGGGNGILAQIQKADLQWERIRHLIVTHEHCDHLLGVVWVFRKIATMIKADQYKQDFHIWCHAKLEQTIRLICEATFWYGRKSISPKDAGTTPEASTSPMIWTFWIWRLTPERANECQAH